jgi:hypothetical protein
MASRMLADGGDGWLMRDAVNLDKFSPHFHLLRLIAFTGERSELLSKQPACTQRFGEMTL